MATTVTNSSRGLVRAALAFALTGLLAVLSGGLLIISGGPASSVPTADDTCVPSEAWTGYWTGSGESQDPADAAWVTESPGEGWYVVDEQTVVDQEATREETGWVTESPGDDWVQLDQRTVDGELVTPAVDQWWHWNPGDAGGVQDPTGPPPVAGWNTDEGNHTGLLNNDNYVANAPFNASNESSGNSSWFFHGMRDAVYDQVTEYRFYLETPEVTHLEYQFAYDHEAVECDDDTEPPEVLPTETTAPTEPSEPAESTEPAGPTEPSDTTGPEQPADLEVLGEQATRPTRTVPQAVEAGVAGRTTEEMWGAGLLGGGLVMLVTAGGALIGARRLEVA